MQTKTRPATARSLAHDATSGVMGVLFESLEAREMMTVSIATPIPDATTQRGAGAITIDLQNRYTDPAVSNVVRFNTNLGSFQIAMFGPQAQATVDNFLAYVDAGRYNNTIFHRLTAVSQGGIGVLQGGGFTRPAVNLTGVNTPVGGIPQAVTTFPAINLQNPTGNNAFTFSMARTNSPNSATSQFFINAVDNRSALDEQRNAQNQVIAGREGYAVFARAFPGSEAIITQLYTQGAANPLNNQWNLQGAFTGQPIAGAFGEVPLVSTFNGNFPIRPTDYLSILSATRVAGMFSQVSVTSGNSNIATAAIDGNQLIVTPVPGAIGTVNITVTATGFDNSVVQDTFSLTINPAAPTAQAFQARDDWSIGRNMPVFLAGVRDTDSAVSRVDFYRDTNNNGQYDDGTDILLASDNTAADGFFASLPTGSFTVGDNTIFARIVDSDNAATVVTQVVTMREAPAAPTVTPSTNSVAPGEGFSLDIGSNLGADDVRRVQVFLDVNNNSGLDRLGDDRLLGTASFNAGTGNWVFDGNASQLSLGANRLFIRVQDVFGNLSAATAITITLA